MKIKILASGCAACISFYELFKRVAADYNPQIEVELVDNIIEIINYRTLDLPAVVINERVVASGEHLTHKEINDLLTTHFKKQ